MLLVFSLFFFAVFKADRSGEVIDKIFACFDGIKKHETEREIGVCKKQKEDGLAKNAVLSSKLCSGMLYIIYR